MLIPSGLLNLQIRSSVFLSVLLLNCFRLENCRNAMQAAKDNFDIPLIVTPENLASPDLDELSGMTYLSYFMKVDSPGYFATLGWTKQMIPHKNVNNFQVNDYYKQRVKWRKVYSIEFNGQPRSHLILTLYCAY